MKFFSILSILFVAWVAFEISKYFLPFKSRDDVLFQQFVTTSNFTLSNGYKTSMPFNVYNATGTILFSYAKNIELARNSISENNTSQFRPVIIRDSRDGLPKAIVLLWFVSYFDTVVGPYEEFLYSILVEPKDAPYESNFCNSNACGFHYFFSKPNMKLKMLDTWVTQENTLIYGRDYLAVDKSVEKLVSKRETNNSLSIEWNKISPKIQSEKFVKLDLQQTPIHEPIYKRLLQLPIFSILSEFGFKDLFKLVVKQFIWVDPLVSVLISPTKIHSSEYFKSIEPTTIAISKFSPMDTCLFSFDPTIHSISFNEDSTLSTLQLEHQLVFHGKNSRFIYLTPFNQVHKK